MKQIAYLSGLQHLPGVEPSSWHAALAKHSLPYVRPSLPQTGSTSRVQSQSGWGSQGSNGGDGGDGGGASCGFGTAMQTAATSSTR
eukprot:scaffold100101_cov66-Phaeocystis_antarctica.AAC.1